MRWNQADTARRTRKMLLQNLLQASPKIPLSPQTSPPVHPRSTTVDNPRLLAYNRLVRQSQWEKGVFYDTSFLEIVIYAEVSNCEIDGSSIKIIGVVFGLAFLILFICHKAFKLNSFTIISFNVFAKEVLNIPF